MGLPCLPSAQQFLPVRLLVPKVELISSQSSSRTHQEPNRTSFWHLFETPSRFYPFVPVQTGTLTLRYVS